MYYMLYGLYVVYCWEWFLKFKNNILLKVKLLLILDNDL